MMFLPLVFTLAIAAQAPASSAQPTSSAQATSSEADGQGEPGPDDESSGGTAPDEGAQATSPDETAPMPADSAGAMPASQPSSAMPASQPTSAMPASQAADALTSSEPADLKASASQPSMPSAARIEGASVVVAEGEPEERPLRVREDILPWTSFASGLGLSLLGAVVAGLGAWPALSILRAQVVLAEVNGRGAVEGDQSLIALRNAEIYDRNLLFQRVGAPVLGAGLGLIVCGVLMTAGGLYAGVVMTQGE